MVNFKQEIAKEIAIELGHNYIGTEHILYGLTEEENGVASKVLENQNLNNITYDFLPKNAM